MAEQTFRSPGFFEQEIDLSGRTQAVEGVPAGIIGTSERGPAFVPVTVGTFTDFQQTFGGLDPKRFAPYAVEQWLANRTAVTFTRVLGAGSNTTTTDISRTAQYGVVKSAGFVISGTTTNSSVFATGPARALGVTKFIVASHEANTFESVAFPSFTDNASINDATQAKLVRGMVLLATGTNLFVTSAAPTNASITPTEFLNTRDAAAVTADGFKLILSAAAGTFTNDAGKAGGNTRIRIFDASLNPTSENYISKVLNTDPLKFQEQGHLLYADFAVEDEIARVSSLDSAAVAIVSGSLAAGAKSPGGTAGKYQDLFGRFDTRYSTPTTPSVTSQPFGDKVYDLFRFETLDDGAYANNKFKVSIANIVASTDPSNKFCKFDVQVRAFGDTDTAPQILEVFPECNLDPTSDRYVAAVVGDKKVVFDHDAELAEERRLVITGKYANVSRYIRVLPTAGVMDGDVPVDAAPFGFRGLPVVKTSDTMTDGNAALSFDGRTFGSEDAHRLEAELLSGDGTNITLSGSLTASIVPPLPHRFKITRGAQEASPSYEGQPGADERVDNRLYWGVKFETCPTTGTLTNAILDNNASSTPNPLVTAYTKLTAIAGIDMAVTGSGADAFNNNGFTLARVGLGPDTDVGTPTAAPTAFTQITGSAKAHMLGAAYVRNGTFSTTATGEYVVSNPGGISNRVTLATLLASSSVTFNRFTPYAKFTMPFYGGFDGFNILDPDIQFGNDRSTSQDTGGLAGATADVGLSANIYDTANTNPMGTGFRNNSIASFRTAAEINTDPFAVRINLLAIPGIKDTAVTDFASERVRDYSQALYVMDIPEYGMQNGITSTRLYDDSTLRADVLETAEQFAGRAIDNSYVATYFPSVIIEDSQNNRRVKVPPSIAALAAFGFNDRVAYPWFAPAGFNRGALDFVKNTSTRLTQADRDTLYDTGRINPIANFPTGGFVIFGQKTLQQASSALDRVNVRRMLLEVKRIISQVARNLLFEQNNATTRSRFTAQATPLLALIQAQQGIESFQVVMDDTNNTELDREQNKLNGRIVVVPTRAIEFIAIDFIITNAGVSFE